MIDVTFWRLDWEREQDPQSVSLHRGRKPLLENVDYVTALRYVLLEAKGSDVYREGIAPSQFVRQLRMEYLKEPISVRVSNLQKSAT